MRPSPSDNGRARLIARIAGARALAPVRVAVLAAGRLALLHLLERDGLVLRLLRLDVLDPRVPDRAEEDDRDRRCAAPG